MSVAVETNWKLPEQQRGRGGTLSLMDVCDPLFDYVCRLNRSARKGGQHDLSSVRGDIKNLLTSMRQRAGNQPGLSDQYDKIEIVLIFFVDFMIKESSLYFAREWKELAFERNELAGDEKFFDLLDEILQHDKSEAANERLTIFYTCVGLGFTGWYTGQPEYLRKKMMEISARIRASMEAGGGVICPEAYEHVDTRDLIEPPGAKLFGIVIALIGLILVLFVANGYLYYRRSKSLQDDIRWLGDHAPKPAQNAGAAAPAK